jgi:hypothetical protein
LILNVLLKHFINFQLPDIGQDTQYLDKLLADLQESLSSAQGKMDPVASTEARVALTRLFEASCQKYWTSKNPPKNGGKKTNDQD